MRFLSALVSFMALTVTLIDAGPIRHEAYRRLARAGPIYNITSTITPSSRPQPIVPDNSYITGESTVMQTASDGGDQEPTQVPEQPYVERQRARTTTLVFTKGLTKTVYVPTVNAPHNTAQPPPETGPTTSEEPTTSRQCLHFPGFARCIPQRGGIQTPSLQTTTAQATPPISQQTGINTQAPQTTPVETTSPQCLSLIGGNSCIPQLTDTLSSQRTESQIPQQTRIDTPAPQTTPVAATSSQCLSLPGDNSCIPQRTCTLSSQPNVNPTPTNPAETRLPQPSQTPSETQTPQSPTVPVEQPTSLPATHPAPTLTPLPVTSGSPDVPGSPPYPEFASNIPLAIERNHEFLTLKVGDKCNTQKPLEAIACSQEQQVLCDPGTATYQNATKCPLNTECFAVPLKTCVGFAVACLAPEDAAARFGMGVGELRKAIADGKGGNEEPNCTKPGDSPSDQPSQPPLPTPAETSSGMPTGTLVPSTTPGPPQITSSPQHPGKETVTQIIISTVTING